MELLEHKATLALQELLELLAPKAIQVAQASLELLERRATLASMELPAQWGARVQPAHRATRALQVPPAHRATQVSVGPQAL